MNPCEHKDHLFKTANGNPLKHKKPHKKTQKPKPKNTLKKRKPHKPQRGQTKDTQPEKTHAHKHTNKNTNSPTNKRKPPSTPTKPHTSHKPHTHPTPSPLQSHAENARSTKESRQGVTKTTRIPTPTSRDVVRRKRAHAVARHARGRASRARGSEVGGFGGALRPQSRRDG